MTQQVGLRRVVSTAERFGFTENLEPIPALPLGVTEVSMRELTAAYTPFPNLGIRVEPYLLTEVRDRRGKSLFREKRQQKRVCDADAAYVMHSLLRGVVRRGTASRLKRYGLNYVAGKTGTTNDYRDAWFVGYTPDMVTTVWVGFDHGAPLRLSSAEAAIPIWGAYMSAIPHQHGEPEPPAGVTFREIDPETGMLWDEGCPGPFTKCFSTAQRPRPTVRAECWAASSGACSSIPSTSTSRRQSRSRSSANGQTRWIGTGRRWRGFLGRIRRIFRRD